MVQMLTKKQKEEYLTKLRKKINDKSKGGSRRDPNEFRPPKAKDGEELNYYYRILPELSKGEECDGGLASRDYDFYFYEHGAHWIDNRPVECPRIHDGEECEICKLGFELLNDESDIEQRRAIAKRYLPRSYYSINIYFLNNKRNPEDLRGRVMWGSVPKTVYDILDSCLNSDDPGDEDDPRAFGFFHDVTEGYVFKLNVKKKGEFNTYEGSRFLPNTLDPLVKTEDGKVDADAINVILNKRHDLVEKFDARDKDKISGIVKKWISGDDAEPEPKDDPKPEAKKEEDDDLLEEKPKKKAKAKKPKAEAKKEPEPEPEPKESESADEEEDEDDPELQALMDYLNEDD